MDSVGQDPRVTTKVSWPCVEPFEGELPRSHAWTSSDVTPADWRVEISDACLTEIAWFVDELRASPIPTLLLTPDDYELPECRRLVRQVKDVLDHGIGFAVVDRLPVERFSKAELTAVYWLLSQMIARPVAQAFNGTMLYDVRDTGVKTAPRVRGDVTSDELSWHTDYGFHMPPPYIGLLVLRTARSGGVSSVASLYTGHNELRRRHPELLQRLYQPFYWNRQGEHPDGDAVCTVNPVFSVLDDVVRSRFNKFLQPVGYRLVDQTIDDTGMRALETLHAVLSEPEHHVSFTLEAGQMQFLNNARTCHSRTQFQDYEEADRKRHLVRIFLRDEAGRGYMG